MSEPRLSDPASSPRLTERGAGAVKRERPIWERLQFGPWKCDVRVVPITGMRQGYPVFEVNVAWQHGPALDESLGAPPPSGMAGVDQYVVDREARDLQLAAAEAQEFSVELARRAAELLEHGVKPDLFVLVRDMLKRRK